jgi:hypothetical protein
MSLVFDPSEFTSETVKEVQLTIVGKGDKKGFEKRAQRRRYGKKRTKRRDPTLRGMEPIFQEKE